MGLTKKDLKQLYNDYMYQIHILNKRGKKTSDQVKAAIKNMIYSLNLDNNNCYEELEFYAWQMSKKIDNKENEDFYIKLLGVIAKRVNESNFLTLFGNNKNDFNSVFKLISKSDELCLENIDKDSVIKVFEETQSFYKIRSMFMLLTDYDLNLVKNIINNLPNIDDEEKLKSIYTIVLNMRPNICQNNVNINNLFNYITIDKDNRYDRNVNSIINKLLENRIINTINPIDNNIVELIFEANIHNYKNKNMKVLIEMLDEKFILTDNCVVRDKIVETTLNMNFICEEHKELYKQVISNVILPSDYRDTHFKESLLDTLQNIQSPKSLQLLLDIYPFINKYNNNEEIKEIINVVTDEKQKVKQIVIPIHR